MKIAAAVLMTAAIALSQPASAALLESQSQIETRYGKPIKVNTPAPGVSADAIYETDAGGSVKLHIHVKFVGDRAQFIRITNDDGFIPQSLAQPLLEANAPVGMKWELYKAGTKPEPRLRGEGTHWMGTSGRAEAYVEHLRAGKKGDKHIQVKFLLFATDKWLDDAKQHL